jgi:hypothetical protein
LRYVQICAALHAMLEQVHSRHFFSFSPVCCCLVGMHAALTLARCLSLQVRPLLLVMQLLLPLLLLLEVAASPQMAQVRAAVLYSGI